VNRGVYPPGQGHSYPVSASLNSTYPFLWDIVLSILGLGADGNPLAPSQGGAGGV
jgi:hypothetical protein